MLRLHFVINLKLHELVSFVHTGAMFYRTLFGDVNHSHKQRVGLKHCIQETINIEPTGWVGGTEHLRWQEEGRLKEAERPAEKPHGALISLKYNMTY